MPNVWLVISKKWKSTIDFMVFHPTDKIPSILQVHQGQKLKRWKLLHKKVFVGETNFHIWDTWSIRCHYPRHCTILGKKHIYFHLVHSRRVHILGHTTECNIALGQCSCSKRPPTTRWVFNVSGIEDEYCTSSGSSGEFFWTVNRNLARKDFAENDVFDCASYPIHWPFLVMGFVVVPF